MKHWKSSAALVAAVALSLTAMPLAADDHTGFIPDLVADLDRVGEKLVALAEATPADKFSFRPDERVRTVSEIYMHVVGTNLLLPPALGMPPLGETEMPDNPMAKMAEWEATVTDKAQVVERLKQSLEYAKSSISAMDPAELDTMVALFGPEMSKRAYLMILQTHAHEHLGQSIAYARSQGIVPPWSQPAPAGGGSGGEGEGEGDGEGHGEGEGEGHGEGEPHDDGDDG